MPDRSMAAKNNGKPMLTEEGQSTRRDRILAVADRLFYEQGIRAVGVDTIIAESGVAKTTLYRYFPSKDDLVVAYLEQRNQRFWELMEIAIAKHPNQPKAQLLVVFEWLDKLLAKPDCLGCPFLVTTAEFAQLDYPGHQVAVRHKLAVRSRLIQLAEQAGTIQPQQVGAQLLLLIDGAFAQRRLFGQNAEISLFQAANALIEAHFSITG